MDADSIFHFINNKENPVIKEIISNLSYKFIFTPNSGEFQRLYNSFYLDFEAMVNPEEENFLKSLDLQEEILEFDVGENLFLFQREIKLSKILGNKIILKKGFTDVITNGKTVLIVGNKGSNKRCGGIGDILSGIIASIVSLNRNSEIDILKCVASACFICREASRNAFKKYYYSMTAPNVIDEISFSMSNILKENYSKMDN
jgi:ATP-dependent NAD(P)H-hydrate dehydratase